MISKRKFVSFICFILLGLLLSACEPRKEPLNLGGNNWLGYQPLYLAQQFGLCADCPYRDSYIGQRPLRFRTLPSTTVVLRLFHAGEFDGVLVTLDEALVLNERAREDICVAQVLSYSNGADALVTRADFDLNAEQMRVGLEQTALGAYMLARTQEELNLNASQFETVNLAPDFHLNALQTGQVDAVISYEPYVSKMVQAGGEVRFSSEQLKGEIADLLVVTQDAFRKHRDVFEWMEQVYWTFGLDQLNTHSDDVDTFLSSGTSLSREELMASLGGIHFIDPREESVNLDEFHRVERKVADVLSIQGGKPLLFCSELDS